MSGATFVIAEAGVNHNGDPALAHALVDAAVEAGADCVKFQTFKADKLASAGAKKAAYQEASTGPEESQRAMLRRLELSEAIHHELLGRCVRRGIEFLSTPFDQDSLRFLVDDLGLRRLKLGSGELTNGPLLLDAARTRLPLILSTGMASLGEVEDAVALLCFAWLHPDREPPPLDLRRPCIEKASDLLVQRLILLQCTTEYPAPFADVNLRAMDTLRERFGVLVGLSDHTPGIAAPIAAVARGARVIEKHFTLDRSLPGPDHGASLEPGELAAMITAIRQIEAALGRPEKTAAASELGNRAIARKGVVAAVAIAAGEPFTHATLTSKRPEQGLSPMRLWELLGRRAARAYAEDEPIDPRELSSPLDPGATGPSVTTAGPRRP